MYYWNIRNLKQELAARRLGEGELFNYFFALLVLEVVMLEAVGLLGGSEDNDWWDYAGALGTIAITLGGTLLAYRAHGGSAGAGFLGRYFPLLWVLTVRFLVFSLPVLLLGGLVALVVVPETLFVTASGEISAWLIPGIVLAAWCWLLVFYYRLVVHVRDVARAG